MNNMSETRRVCRAAPKYAKSRQDVTFSDKDSIKIETKTLAKKTTIEWKINKQTIEIAKMSAKGEDKGVIGTSVDFGGHTFNLELCVPGTSLLCQAICTNLHFVCTS